jgi:hypothetical protein
MSPVEIDRTARAIWENIADETGRTGTHAGKVARLYLLCRDVQHARAAGAGVKSILAIAKLVTRVAENAVALRVAR